MGRFYAGVFALIGWVAVDGQYFAGHSGTLAGTIDYFSYFKILGNILVATTLTMAALLPQSALGKILLKPQVATATVIYISVTGLTYFLIQGPISALRSMEHAIISRRARCSSVKRSISICGACISARETNTDAAMNCKTTATATAFV